MIKFNHYICVSNQRVMFPAYEARGFKCEVHSAQSKGEYLALGVPEEWVEPLQKQGYTTIEKL